MTIEKQAAQQIGNDFVQLYYACLNQAPDKLYKFYGKDSSYVHGGVDSEGRSVEAVYGQSDIQKRVMALSFKDCQTRIRHMDAYATISDGVVVHVMGEQSNNLQPKRKFVQTFFLALKGTASNHYYIYNDVFHFQDNVFGEFELPKESEEKVVDLEESVPSSTVSSEPEVPEDNDEASVNPEPEPEVHKDGEASVNPEPEPEVEKVGEPSVEKDSEASVEDVEAPAELEAETLMVSDKTLTVPPSSQPLSWASVTSKFLPPRGPVPVKAQRPQRRREKGPGGPPPVQNQSKKEGRRVVQHPDAHQLFVGNIPCDVEKSELTEFFQQYGTVLAVRIISGGKQPNFAFVVFDNSEPVQKILSKRRKRIKFRGNVWLNVAAKKTRSTQDGDRQDPRPEVPVEKDEASVNPEPEPEVDKDGEASVNPEPEPEVGKDGDAVVNPEPEPEVHKDGEASVNPEPEPEVEKVGEASVEKDSEALVEDVEAPAELEAETLMVSDETLTVPPSSQPLSWASVTSKFLPPRGPVPVKAQRPQRRREKGPGGPPPVQNRSKKEGRRVVQHPDTHQLFVGNIPHEVEKNALQEIFEQYGTVLAVQIISGGKQPNFAFVVFDNSEPVQKILSKRRKRIKFRGNVWLNVAAKKTRSTQEGDRQDPRPEVPVENDEASVNPEPEPEVDKDGEASVSPEPEPEVEMDSEASVNPEPEPEVGKDGDAVVNPEPEPEVHKDGEASVNPEPEPEVEKVGEASVEKDSDALVEDVEAPAELEAETLMVSDETLTVPPSSQPLSWASVTSKFLPPRGPVPIKAQRPQRRREKGPGGPPPVQNRSEKEGRRVVQHPDTHQLFVGNIPHEVEKNELQEIFEQYGTVLAVQIISGGKQPNFAFVVFDNSEPVQKILSKRRKRIKFRGDVWLNVAAKKTRSTQEGDRQDSRPHRGPDGPGSARERGVGADGPRGPPMKHQVLDPGRAPGPTSAAIPPRASEAQNHSPRPCEPQQPIGRRSARRGKLKV